MESRMTMEGQMCCYAKANSISPKKQTVWLIVGNTDGFRIYVNGKNVLENTPKSEMELILVFGITTSLVSPGAISGIA